MQEMLTPCDKCGAMCGAENGRFVVDDRDICGCCVVTIRLASLKGKFEIVSTVHFRDEKVALEYVRLYARGFGFHSVKTVDDGAGSIRYTATSARGRAGRNVAFRDVC